MSSEVPDLTAMTDDELDRLARDCNSVVFRRQALAQLPAQAAGCAAQYQTNGGDPQIVADAVQAWVNTHQEATA